MRANNVRVVLGSALLWAWGFLCFLSPALFPERGGLDASIGLEYGFFASQASVLVCAGVVVLVSRWRRFIVKRGTFFVAALLVALTTLVLTWAVRADALAVIVACGVIDGGAVMLLGVAWGARYSLGSQRMRSLVVLSFLVAYLLYLVVAQIPGPTSIALVCALPLASWALWRSDAVMRHELSSEVFPSRAAAGEAATPGELMAGSWEARVLPWRAVSVLIAATFIGNLMASVLMGRSYAGVDSLFFGGIVVCASIATMMLVPLTARRASISVDGVYRITVTFTAVGLVAIMVFGTAAVPRGRSARAGQRVLPPGARVPRHHPEHAGAGTVAAAVVQRGAGARFGSGVCRQRSGQAGVRPVRFRRFRAGRDVRPGAAGVVLHAGAACGRSRIGRRAPLGRLARARRALGRPGRALWPPIRSPSCSSARLVSRRATA